MRENAFRKMPRDFHRRQRPPQAPGPLGEHVLRSSEVRLKATLVDRVSGILFVQEKGVEGKLVAVEPRRKSGSLVSAFDSLSNRVPITLRDRKTDSIILVIRHITYIHRNSARSSRTAIVWYH